MTYTRAALAALATVLLAGCGSTAAPAAAPTPSPSPPSSSAPVHLDERAACQLLVPTMQDAKVVMDDFVAHTDGSTVDRAALKQSIANIQQAIDYGPPDLTKLLTDAIGPLKQLEDAFETGAQHTIDTKYFYFPAQGVIDKCKPFTG